MPKAESQKQGQACVKGSTRLRRVFLIAPSPPPYGGMALQAQLLERLLQNEGCAAYLFASNQNFPRQLQSLSRVRFLKPFARAAIFSWRLLKETRRHDVIHIFAASWLYFFLVVYPALLVGRLKGAVVVLNYRGGEAFRFFRRFGPLAAPAFALAHCVTAPSEFLAGVIRRRFHIPVAIVPNVLDGVAFQYRERSAFSPKLLVTRHLEAMYDVGSILKAFCEVQRDYPEASLWIAGSGTQEAELRATASRLNLQNVQFLGSVKHDNLAAIADQCDILINASLVDNFPGALLEGSAGGLAIISTNPGGIPYIYQNGQNAILVEPGDWKGLAQGVKDVIRFPERARSMATRGAELARSCYWSEVRQPLFLAYGFSAGEYQNAATAPNDGGLPVSVGVDPCIAG